MLLKRQNAPTRDARAMRTKTTADDVISVCDALFEALI